MPPAGGFMQPRGQHAAGDRLRPRRRLLDHGRLRLSGATLPEIAGRYFSGHGDGCSITGGYVYRGATLPEIAGRYFYSDFCTGFLRSFLFAGGSATERTNWDVTPVGNVQSFGVDSNDELYLMTAAGGVYRLARATGG